MTNQEMIDEMSKMQRALDNAIYKEHGCEFDEEKCTLAMIDEIGEFNHEVKSTWCWWKKTQKEMDREKTLEELVDVWHFALSLTYHYVDADPLLSHLELETLHLAEEQYDPTNDSLVKLFSEVIYFNVNRFDALYAIGMKFGFTLEDVYRAYKKKNQVNYERLASNY